MTPDPAPRPSAATIGVLLGSVVVAAYTGIRMPSRWTATLQTVSLQDGFHRRFLVGTLLRPIAQPTGYAYGLFVAVSFVVLAALVAVLVRVAVTTRIPARRLLIVAFLLLPTGGYLFHEVGYFDQLLYLMFFGSLWLLGRGRAVAAAAMLALAVTVHEIAVLTVLPLFFLAALRASPLRRAVLAVMPAALVGGVILVASAAVDGAGNRLGRRLTDTGFPLRPDALELFGRTQRDSWRLYSPSDVLLFLLPLFVIVVGAVFALARTNARRSRRSAVPIVVWIAAAGAPVVLAAAGWDRERWAFLLIANFCVVVWFLLAEHPPEVGHSSHLVLVAALLLTAHVPLTYFDGYAPRALTADDISDFAERAASGSFTDTPPR
ncbi:hypothetical protein [Embleya sp. NBC_00896]|uniref:hypothetical protein n=1 Tax=Embleya sp. NBC_00896 TaxID=2975961 RepID=UPI0038681250|nr:hypothetical protein OG928_32080 [Embleya sp. NBC_00896]